MKTIHNDDYEKNQINDIHNIFECVIRSGIYSKVKDVVLSYAPSEEPIDFNHKDSLKFIPIKVGDVWGKNLFDCAWFHLECDLSSVGDTSDLYLAFDINGEALLFNNNGEPIKGFTPGSSVFDRNLGEPGKRYYPISSLIGADKKLSLYLDAGFNDLFGNIQEEGKIKFAYICRKDYQTEEVYNSGDVLLTYLQNIDRTNPFFNLVLQGLLEVRDYYWYDAKDKYSKSILELNKLLGIKSNSNIEAVCLGHSHLDLAWLWPIRESKRKAVRTMCNVIYLLDKYPEFHFVISQPQQLIWVKENAPELFLKIKDYEKKGRIELVGGGFVEMDTNITSEEQLARQMLYGQKYWKENFGHYTKVMWLPDTFGYSGALPQLMKQSGQDYFVTTKISWCTVNKFPYHNFIWKGIDGTGILTHLPPEGTYNSASSPKSLLKMEENIYPVDKYNKALILFGIGDGAGGPGDEHLNRIEKEKSLLDLPHTKWESTVDFFKGLENVQSDLKTHKGELYLENHQGTYTSQSEMKRLNRLTGERIKVLEWYLNNSGISKYNEELKEIYQRSLLLEFHDILPGSSISRVYKEAKEEYTYLNDKLDKICEESIKGYLPSYKKGAYVINHLNYAVRKLFKDDGKYYLLNIKANSSSNSYEELSFTKNIDSNEIDADEFKITFDKSKGFISSIFDKRVGKQIILDGGNKLRVFRDHGDAWNILDSYRNQDEVLMDLKQRSIKQYGYLFEVSSVYTFKNSRVEEVILIDSRQGQITFNHKTDWHDVGYMLRSNFNLDVKADEAVCDIQFGTLNRSRKEDTSINKAQFEVCAQNFVDVSDKDYGVSLFNRTKDGYYIKGNNLELCLLRSTDYPCKNGDVGSTEYSYSLYLHNCAYQKSNCDKLAYIFNSGFLISEKKNKINSLVKFTNDDIEYSAYKTPYDNSKGGIILRLYERSGKKTKVNLKLDSSVSQIDEVNILEDVQKENVSNVMEFKPFEVKTLWIH